MATTGYFQSYSVGEDLGLTFDGNISTSSDCQNANYITVSTVSPYNVFGTPYGGGCASMVLSVDDDGKLESAIANATYDSSAGVHGGAMDTENKFFYSADGKQTSLDPRRDRAQFVLFGRSYDGCVG